MKEDFANRKNCGSNRLPVSTGGTERYKLSFSKVLQRTAMAGSVESQLTILTTGSRVSKVIVVDQE